MSRRKIFTILGIVAVGLCIVVILLSASEFVNPYRSVLEVANNAANFMGQHIQMIGKVVNGSIQTGGGDLSFEITDGEAVLNVVYLGATPQNFKEGIDVVVIGSLIQEEVFKATEILTKCPSKYV